MYGVNLEVGGDGLTAIDVEHIIKTFSENNDLALLDKLEELVKWCMKNGLEKFNTVILARYGKGLLMYKGTTTQTTPLLVSQTPKRDAVGVDGLTGGEIECDLRIFYAQNDSAQTSLLPKFVGLCLILGLQECN